MLFIIDENKPFILITSFVFMNFLFSHCILSAKKCYDKTLLFPEVWKIRDKLGGVTLLIC